LPVPITTTKSPLSGPQGDFGAGERNRRKNVILHISIVPGYRAIPVNNDDLEEHSHHEPVVTVGRDFRAAEDKGVMNDSPVAVRYDVVAEHCTVRAHHDNPPVEQPRNKPGLIVTGADRGAGARNGRHDRERERAYGRWRNLPDGVRERAAVSGSQLFGCPH